AALSGHLCRCGAYDGIFSAVAAACEGKFDGGDIVSPRVEARDKVTGIAKYTVDIHHDGQLEGIILRSQQAHSRIGELDFAPLLVEGTFRTGTQSHACLEPHAAVARFDGDQLTVHASTQSVFHLMELIAKRFKLEHDKVQVIADHVGGGFGSKASLGVETTTAIELARAANAPVRVAYDRHEELSVTGYRPATEVKIALLPSEQGALKALSLTAYADTGAATNSTIAALARLIYPAEAKELADYDVISNLPPGAAFRGPGGPPMAFALEQAIDEAALRMNIDPITLRKR